MYNERINYILIVTLRKKDEDDEDGVTMTRSKKKRFNVRKLIVWISVKDARSSYENQV